MTAELSLHGLLIGAGETWWLFAPDLRDLVHPAVAISDDTGGAWRYTFDLFALLASFTGS